MKPLSTLAQSVRASTTMAIDTQFKKMRAEGIDVIGFSVGEPDFPTPERIKQAGIRAIEADQTKYTPTPGTLATCMWYTGLDPRTMQPVFVPRTPHDKALQRALLQWKRPEMRRLVTEALHRAHRTDLIGYGKDCLIRPLHGGREEEKPAAAHREKPGKGPRQEERRGKGPARREDRAAAGSSGRGRYGKAVSGGKTAADRARDRAADRPGKAPFRGPAKGSAAARKSEGRGRNGRGR